MKRYIKKGVRGTLGFAGMFCRIPCIKSIRGIWFSKLFGVACLLAIFALENVPKITVLIFDWGNRQTSIKHPGRES